MVVTVVLCWLQMVTTNTYPVISMDKALYKLEIIIAPIL